MIKKLKLVVLTDADVVIHAHENNYWELLCTHHRIALAATVIEDELLFYRSNEGKKGFKISTWFQKDKVERLEAELTDVESLYKRLNPDFLASLHRGELEALAILLSRKQNKVHFTTGDRAAMKALGVLNLGSKGISVEELLSPMGRNPKSKLPHHLTKKWLQKSMSEGLQEQHLWLK